ncbi:hypothetical protein L3X38_016982 [Prunus dulcis]|uniref:Uncharacterized protein n=1 Tax=Prunus dulcis TaxID=3755 RepID=A0AAD4W8V0_PRUDU|nr:hypothetical protein L3X38_016982 [Prunus dulcis]
MELSELEQLLIKTVRQLAGRAFLHQAAAGMEMWLCMKRALNAANRYRERFEDSRVRIAEAGKAIQDADGLAEENATKITELSSKLAAVQVALVEAQVREAKVKGLADCRNSEKFTALLDKEVMDQCDNLVYRFKRHNANNKLSLNFLRDLPSLPKGVTEEMVEVYKGEDANADSSEDTDSSSKKDEALPTPPAADASAADADDPSAQ